MAALTQSTSPRQSCCDCPGEWAVSSLVILAVVVSLGMLWFTRGRVNNWGVVESGEVYRSGQLSPGVIRDVLRRNHIARIVALGADKDGGVAIETERKTAHDLGIDRIDFGLNGDGIGDPEVYTRAISIIADAQRKGEPVLVHCHSGAQRTGGVIAVYRMLLEHKTPTEAYSEMQRYGYDYTKNPDLIRFINDNMERWTRELRDLHVIEAAPATTPRLTP